MLRPTAVTDGAKEPPNFELPKKTISLDFFSLRLASDNIIIKNKRIALNQEPRVTRAAAVNAISCLEDGEISHSPSALCILVLRLST